MKTKPEYDKQKTSKQAVNEPVVEYGSIDALKARLVKQIMGMEALEDVRSVLNFVEERKSSNIFDLEWERGLSPEQFRNACKDQLKEIYADMRN